MSLNEKINQNIFIPKGNLNIPRRDMPQIMLKDFNDFFKWLGAKGISVSKNQTVIAKNLRPTQKEISIDSVNFLATSGSPKLKLPFLVTKDGYILDGHHRWLALLKGDKNIKIKVHIINTTIQDALRVASNYPKVFFKSIDTTPSKKFEQTEYMDVNECAMMENDRVMTFKEYLKES